LPIRLVFHGPDVEAAPVSVEFPDYLGPAELIDKMEKHVEDEWKKLLKKKKAGEPAWQVVPILEFVEAKFADLLMLCPEHMQSYIGCDYTGASMRRYVLVQPREEAEEEEEEEEVDEEEEERRRAEWVERESARIEKLYAEQDADATKKRQQAEAGIFEDGEKVKQMTKAEKAEANKSRKEKSGHRWRKTPAKTNKPTKEEEKAAKKK